MSETNTESWDGLLKNYLKASNLKEHIDSFACTGLNVNGTDMDLELMRDEEKFVFSLNVTNKVFLKNNGISKPKEIIGKKIHMEKVKAFNPTLKQEVDSLRIIKVE